MLENAGSAILIIGASAAGMAAAQTLRAEGYRGAITVIDRDPDMPYERPPLSKSGFASAADAVPIASAEGLEQLGITLLAGAAALAIEPQRCSVRLDDGRRLHGQALLIATGGAPVMPNLPGVGSGGIYGLRTFQDRRAIGGSLSGSPNVAVVGGGLVGAECVAACLADGHRVHWIDMAEQPLSHVVPPPVAQFLVQALLRDGAVLHPGRVCAEFLEVHGRLHSIVLDNGAEIAAQTAIIGIGTRPQLPAGLNDGTHLLVDHRQRTQFANVYAAGDVAMRIEDGARPRHCGHWREAQWQGRNAAHAMLGQPEPSTEASWFWSDQGQRHLEMLGTMSTTGDRVVRRDVASSMASFEFEDGHLVGVASVNDIACVRAARRALGKAPPFPPDMLADPANDPRKLLQEIR